ncbi:TonB-linked outer membrane protein, SusC/RagA family [bacterium A37T11]|nr:TonB-linked outer membrane protein, SusC/RagA family [bacterium A37T11]
MIVNPVQGYLRHVPVFVLLIVGYLSFPAQGQERIIVEGTVLDSANLTALPGVSIKVLGTSTETKSMANGRFSIQAPPNSTLLFAYIGYHSQKIVLKGKKEWQVMLGPANENLDEVVVVAYGQQKKVSVTGAISTVQTKDLRKSSSASLANALAGRLTGLTSIQSGGGQPGRDDATLYLRGAATLNGTSPLILIDGVPRDNIRTLDANEVESVSVLKDASATAVFGVRGANGVILITTRRGKEGPARLDISYDQSFTSFTREPERLHSWEYIDLRNEAAANDGIPLPFTQAQRQKYLNPLEGLSPDDPDYTNKKRILNYIYPDHDYYRELIAKYTPQSRLNINASGGTDKLSYFVNGAFLHQGGNLKTEPASILQYDPSSWLDRYNFRSNLDYKLSNRLKAFLNIGSYIERVNMPPASSLYSGDTNWMMRDMLYQAQTILPITPGPTTIDGFGVEPGQIVDPTYLDRSAFEVMNRMGYRNELRSNLNTSLGAEWDLSQLITPGLSIKGMVSFDTRATSYTQGLKSEKLYDARINYATDELSYDILKQDETLLTLSKSGDSRYNINLQGSLNYSRTFNSKHAITGMILAQRDYWEKASADLPFNVIGFSGRITYAYDNRYLAEINAGYNGSEQFSPTHRFGFFPAASLGWVVSNEAFLKDNKVLTSLKLRTSYGKVGNDVLGATRETTPRFIYQDNITVGTGPLPSLGLGQGINQGLLGNKDVTWETATKRNYGADIEILHELQINVDYYTEHRDDILISRGTVPVLQGIPLNNIPKVNMGIVDNKGFEVEVHYQKKLTENWGIHAHGNYGTNKNRVKFYDEPKRDETYPFTYRTTGYSIGQAWGYRIDYSNGNGYFNSQEELDAFLSHTSYGFGSPRVGDFKYKDLNADGIINDKDQAPIKYSNIPGITYGLDIGLSFKGFDVSAFFEGVGHYSTNYAEQGVYENIKQGTYFGYQRTAWTPERYANGEEITYPALSTQVTTNHVANDYFIMDRSFIRLRNAELAYSFSNNLLSQWKIKSLRIYVGGQNLALWDHLRMKHLDPENSDAIGYPVTKMINFGLNITL